MTFRTTQTNKIAFAFDLDGTLIDTERDKAISHQRTVKHFGGDVPLHLYYDFIGNSFDIVFSEFKAYTSIDVSPAAYHDTFNRFYLEELGRNLEPAEGAIDLLDHIVAKGFKIALVTSSERWMVDLILKKIGIDRYFDFLISGDDVKIGKPNPEPYNLAISLLGSKTTFAFEDTRPGILSAKGAGAYVIAIKNDYNSKSDLSDAEKMLTTLKGLDLNELLNK